MPEARALKRVENIQKKIGFIEEVIREYGGISDAPADEAKGRAAILMHLTAIAEQFDKLLHSGELELLSRFDKEDIKGSYELRNFIAHDYEGVDLYEDVIQDRLPIIRKRAEEILEG